MELNELRVEDYIDILTNSISPSGINLHLKCHISGEKRDNKAISELRSELFAQQSECNNTEPALYEKEDIDLEQLSDEKSLYEAHFAGNNFEQDILVQDIDTVSDVFQYAGVGTDSTTMVRIKLSFKKVVAEYPVKSVRFWGIVFGLKTNYFILECMAGNSDVFEDIDEESEKSASVEGGRKKVLEPLRSIPIWKRPPEIPKEEPGEGLNSHVYFVSTNACGPYTRLPHVEPKHISASRQIRFHFTGDLSAPIHCWPPFPGAEAEYLRAQIARISAATQLAPQGFFRFRQGKDDDERELDDNDFGSNGRTHTECEENDEYEPKGIENMELKDWVHARPYILPQGRVTWWTLQDVETDEGSGDERSEGESGTVPPLEELKEEPPKPEHGPSILTPITEDVELDGLPPWTMRSHMHGLCLCVSSLLWPGAHTVACGKIFDNIYVGWGLKSIGVSGYQPMLPQVQPDTLYEPREIRDPSPEEEREHEEVRDEEFSEENEDEIGL